MNNTNYGEHLVAETKRLENGVSKLVQRFVEQTGLKPKMYTYEAVVDGEIEVRVGVHEYQPSRATIAFAVEKRAK